MPYVLPAHIRAFVNQTVENSYSAWPVIALGQHEKLVGREYALREFIESFDEVTLGKAECERMFKFNAPERLTYRFFESKKTYPVDDTRNEMSLLIEETRKALNLVFMPTVFAEEGGFFVTMPMADKPTIPMDEFFAGYLVFFFLGSLVRYHPDYLERILRSKEAWIIQRFTTSCATTLLRRASIFLLGENRILCSRS